MPSPAPATDAELIALCQQGRKVEAIGRRLATADCSLFEAKQYVEALLAGPATGPGRPPANPEALEQQVISYYRQGSKLQAIKYYRDQTGVSLLDAKNYVEAVEARLARSPSTSTPLPPLAAVAAPARPRAWWLLPGGVGLFAIITLTTSSLERGADGADAYGFPEHFYRTGTGYAPVQHHGSTYRNFDQQALLLDISFAFGVAVLLYLLGRGLLQKRRSN